MDPVGAIAKAGELLREGLLTEPEFQQLKLDVLAAAASAAATSQSPPAQDAIPGRPLHRGEQLAQPSLHPSTLAIHADGVAVAGGGPIRRFSHDGDIAPPIGVTTTFDRTEQGYVYSRWIAPTRSRAETVLAALEATPGQPTPHALLYSSGLAAVHTALTSLLPRGIRRIAITGGYHGTHEVANCNAHGRFWYCFLLIYIEKLAISIEIT